MRQTSSSRISLFFSALSLLTIVTPPATAQRGMAPGDQGSLKEPIQVTGGLITGTPTIQWVPGVRLYRGIPYAAPPIGDLRWRAPQAVVPWTGVKAADRFSPACMQPPTETSGMPLGLVTMRCGKVWPVPPGVPSDRQSLSPAMK